MKQTIILLAIFFLFIQSGRADDTSCKKMDHQQRVISKNGLIIRAEPNTESQSLGNAPYWAKVNVCWVNQGVDTINNIYGNWRMVEYQNIRGYMFDGFLVHTDSSYENNNDFRFFMEGDHCALPNFDPSLFWYGIYETELGDSLISIDITIRKPQLNEGLDFPWAIIFETNLSKKRKSKYLIGSRIQLEEKIVNKYPLENPLFLYPGQSSWVSAGVSERNRTINSLRLNSLGKVEEYKVSPIFKDYRLVLTDVQNDYKTQDITEFFDFFGSNCFLSLYWYGDIDGDRQVDLMFFACGNAMTKYTLLLSSISNSNEFIGKADEWVDGNCN